MLSEIIKFERAIESLGQVIKAQQHHPESKPTIVIVDEFWLICVKTTLGTTRQRWNTLLALLGCASIGRSGNPGTGPPSVAPNFRVLIRINGWFEQLKELGFSGGLCTPSAPRHDGPILREALKGLL